jgi:hypothetical protein
LSDEVAAGPGAVVLTISVKVVEGAIEWNEVVALLCPVTTARCRVSVLVSVTVLVEVFVVMSAATAASGIRRAARTVGRCIVVKLKRV